MVICFHFEHATLAFRAHNCSHLTFVFDSRHLRAFNFDRCRRAWCVPAASGAQALALCVRHTRFPYLLHSFYDLQVKIGADLYKSKFRTYLLPVGNCRQ
jgi:hypothetical protein